MKPINYPEIILLLSLPGFLGVLSKSVFEEPLAWQVCSGIVFLMSLGAIIMGLIFL